MGFFDKLFKRNKEQEEQKVALDEGLKKNQRGLFSQKLLRQLPEKIR